MLPHTPPPPHTPPHRPPPPMHYHHLVSKMSIFVELSWKQEEGRNDFEIYSEQLC